MHCPAEQQPAAQLLALQAPQVPSVQGVPVEHAAQAAPPLPQTAEFCWAKVKQMPLEQHPEQLEDPQLVVWQAPVVQLLPDGHTVQAAPPEPQALADCAVRSMQLPEEQQPPQVAVPQAAAWQVPLLHFFPVGQLVQVPPLPPQALSPVPAWQTPAVSQQPVQPPAQADEGFEFEHSLAARRSRSAGAARRQENHGRFPLHPSRMNVLHAEPGFAMVAVSSRRTQHRGGPRGPRPGFGNSVLDVRETGQ